MELRTGQLLSSLLKIAEDRSRWVPITTEVSVVVPQRNVGIIGL